MHSRKAISSFLAVAIYSVASVPAVAQLPGELVSWGKSIMTVPPSMLGTKAVGVSCFAAQLLRDGTVRAWANGSAAADALVAGGIDQIAVGSSQIVAIRVGGAVAVIGNSLTENGDISVDDLKVNLPAGLNRVEAVAAGAFHALALQDGRVIGWGYNDWGQASAPESMSNVVAIAAGGGHSVAVSAGGSVFCWGSDSLGQCAVPNDLPAASRMIAAGGRIEGYPGRSYLVGSHTMVVGIDGTLRCWGDNSHGQCTPMANLGVVRVVAAGDLHSVAVSGSGTIRCWGENSRGQCNVPDGIGTPDSIAAGKEATVALCRDGSVRAWGWNSDGQFDFQSQFSDLRSIASGYIHTIGVDVSGRVVGWGWNKFGQCEAPSDLVSVQAVAAGGAHSAALLSSGGVRCWGNDYSGQCSVPSDLAPAVSIACAGGDTIARDAQGRVRSWGSMGDWQFNGEACKAVSGGGVFGGAYDTASYSFGLRITGSGVLRMWDGYGDRALTIWGPVTPIAVAGGGYHSVVLVTGGLVQCVGSNTYRQCSPPNLTSVIGVAAGGYHSAALKSDGTVVCWGRDFDEAGGFAGQVSLKPAGLDGVRQIGAGRDYTAVLCDRYSGCANSGDAGSASVGLSAGRWSDVSTWTWQGARVRVPSTTTSVSIDGSRTVGADCTPFAGTLVADSSAGILLPPDVIQGGGSHVITVTQSATVAGRLWLLASGDSPAQLPESLNVPVLSASTVVGNFDLLQTDVPPPPGFFLTLVPEDVNGRTVLSLRLLPLSVGGTLSGSTGTVFSGRTVGAETIDINHDGFDDLALAIDFGAGQNGLVQILLNDGVGNLGGTSVLAAIPPQPTCLAVGDVDGDGDRDVVVGVGSDGTVRVLLDNGAGGFVAGTVIGNLGGTPLAVAVRDVAGGTQLTSGSQIVVGTSSNSLKTFSGSGGPLQTIALAGMPSVVKVGTIDGTRGKGIATGGTTSNSVDGLAAVPTGFVQTILPRIDGSLELVQTMYLTAKPVSMDVADLDGDGLDDIVTANADPVLPAAGSALPVLAIFRNTNGLFGGAVPYQPAGASSGLSVSLVDVDNDGDRDIVSVHRTIGLDSDAELLRVDTLGAGTPISIGQTTVLDTNDPILSARGNLDGGGGEDVFLVNQPSGTSLTGLPEARPFLATGQSRQGDLDGDGTVGASDISILLLDYGVCSGCPSDLDGSGEVDAGDIAFLLLLFD